MLLVRGMEEKFQNVLKHKNLNLKSYILAKKLENWSKISVSLRRHDNIMQGLILDCTLYTRKKKKNIVGTTGQMCVNAVH